MITAVSLNPSIDRTIKIKQFTYGGMNRAVSTRNDASGKAVNVAITAARLDVATECVGFLYKENGRTVENRLLQAGTVCDFLWLEGRVRTNIKLLDESTGKVTEINEAGETVTEDKLEKVLALICDHAVDSDYLVLNGSLPPGCPPDFYKTIIEQVDGLSCRCVLDAEGERFTEGLKAHPFLIKPNMYELEIAIGDKIGSFEDAKRAACSFVKKGVQNVVVSMGDKGAMLVNEDGILYADKLDVHIASTVGAGDAMVAGLVTGFLGEKSYEEILAMGMAAGTASCMTEGTQLMERETYNKLLGMVKVFRL